MGAVSAWRLEEEVPQGDQVRIRLRFDAEKEAVQFALSFGDDIEVTESDELRRKVLVGALAIVRDIKALIIPNSSRADRILKVGRLISIMSLRAGEIRTLWNPLSARRREHGSSLTSEDSE